MRETKQEGHNGLGMTKRLEVHGKRRIGSVRKRIFCKRKQTIRKGNAEI